jgi:ribosomal protein L31
MKKKIHLPLALISFRCLACNQEYQTVSTSARNIKIESCGKCVYPGAATSEAKRGAVEKFRQRAQKVKLKQNS